VLLTKLFAHPTDYLKLIGPMAATMITKFSSKLLNSFIFGVDQTYHQHNLQWNPQPCFVVYSSCLILCIGMALVAIGFRIGLILMSA